MPRQMPPLAVAFAAAVGQAVDLAEAGELIRNAAKKDAVAYRELRPSRLEALHELAYLRVFVQWENFLEAAFLRMQCGYISPIYVPVLHAGKTRPHTLDDAFQALGRGRDYLLWHHPPAIVNRAVEWLVHGPHELVISSNQTRLEWFAAIRHGIAHRSADARAKVNNATLGLAGRRYRGASAGRFLRDWAPGTTQPQRWLNVIADELVALARQITP